MYEHTQWLGYFMYDVTYDNFPNSLSPSLYEIALRYFPLGDIRIEHSELLYDELMRGDRDGFSEQNESYILIKDIQHDCLIIDIVCLHIESLRLSITLNGRQAEEDAVDSCLNEIRISLLKEAIRYQNQMFTKVSDNAWHLASGLSHEIVTQHVIEGALKTIAYSDAAIFRIYDETNDILVPVAMSGFNDNYYDYAVSPNESASGKVFKSQKTIILHSREEILHSFTTTSPVRDEILKSNPVAASLLCVPVYDQQACYGTLTILSFSRQYVFNSLAQSLLETFSSQVALAWRNARLYDERTESLRVVEQLRNQLQAQNLLLESSVNLYNAMVSLSIKYNQLSEFIATMSVMLSVDINYLDVLGNQRLNEDMAFLTWRNLSQLKHNKDDFISLPDDPRYGVFPLESDGGLLAFFMIKKDVLNESVLSIIARLKEFVIMEIYKRASSVTVENKKTLSLIDSIRAGGLTPELEMNLVRRGLSLHKYILCVRLEPAWIDAEDIQYIAVINALGKDVFGKNTLYYFDAGSVTALSSDSSEQKLQAIENRLSAGYQQVTGYKAGLSSILKSAEIVTAIKQSRIALEVLKARNRNGMMNFKHAGIDRLLVKHSSQELKDFITDTLAPVLGENDKSGFLLTTLRCYLKNRQSAVNTAEELNIHVNTLYKRIKKFENLTNLNLSNSDDFLMISLVCHMSQFYLD
ncbi:helix-turn-helix domain-containing protein [Erwinia sp. V71]|uniref:helix-turn-helix domain-containing protein n=1 Tax=Erwinia sp. V71 TaxID=3369424 RepID=UPI003F5F01AC